MTDTIENLDHLDPIDRTETTASETAANAETTEISNVVENAEVSVTETQPVTNSDSAETSATAETSNTPVTEEAPTTENAAPAETAEPAEPAEPAGKPAETAELKLCGTDPKIICDVVHGLFSEPKPAEVKPEEPTRSLEFQTTKVVSSNVVPKVPVQYVENPLKFAKDLKKPTALDKIKDVAANLKLMGKANSSLKLSITSQTPL